MPACGPRLTHATVNAGLRQLWIEVGRDLAQHLKNDSKRGAGWTVRSAGRLDAHLLCGLTKTRTAR